MGTLYTYFHLAAYLLVDLFFTKINYKYFIWFLSDAYSTKSLVYVSHI